MKGVNFTLRVATSRRSPWKRPAAKGAGGSATERWLWPLGTWKQRLQPFQAYGSLGFLFVIFGRFSGSVSFPLVLSFLVGGWVSM